jgi:iron complex outermembrane receptor protein
MSLEELMNETITSVSKREQKLFDAASAIYLITSEDIRRSGITYVAEAFRSVPGMNVAAVNSSQWAVSSRGFNAVYTNKLLVLMDGRPVYTPLFSGVIWELQMPMLEDIERIEVIRGPGATIWGSNAVNGVINIVSQSARDTQGGLLFGGAGDLEQSLAGVRFGGRLGENTYYRVFASEQSRDGFLLTGSSDVDDDNWKSIQGGFRVDHYASSSSQITWQGDATRGDYRNGDHDLFNINTIARLTRDFGAGEGFEVQVLYDRFEAQDPYPTSSSVDTFDVTYEQTHALTGRNALIWGLGYRYIHTSLDDPIGVIIRNDEISQDLFSAFLQNEFTWLPERLFLTTGLKLEHNDYTGAELQPSARLLFKPAVNQTLWAAVSRAVRTPSQLESGDAIAFIAGPPFFVPGQGFVVPALVGNRDPDAETLWAFEVGYRIQPTSRLNIDVATFYNYYDNLVTYGPILNYVPDVPVGIAEVPYVNVAGARTYGGELSVLFAATDTLRLRGGYSLLCQTLDVPDGYYAGDFERAPRHQITFGVAWDPISRVSLDLQGRHVADSGGAPGYVTADIRIAWRPVDNLELSFVGTNLLDPQHLEQAPEVLTRTNEVPRSFHGKVTWRF